MRFDTTLVLVGNNTGILVPPAVLDDLGGGKRPLVNVTVVGVDAGEDFSYRSAVASMGGRSLIAFSSDKRAATGLRGGETIVVELTLDTEPRTVTVPADLADELAGAGLREAFDTLPPSQQKAHVTAVEGAKAAETRSRRIAAVLAKLS
jgi:hypothetical protein